MIYSFTSDWVEPLY